MKRFSFIAAGFIFAAVFAVSAFGQAAVPAGKIGLVNVNAFADEKAGIMKFKNALTSLDPEFKPAYDELRTMDARRQVLAKEIQDGQKPAPAGVPAKAPVNLQAKVDEFQTLELTMKRKQEDLKVKSERRYQQVVGPVYNDILKAMNDYAKAKGYAVILDGAKLEESGILIGFDDKFDVTKDFIVFYNARPAGTATTATPK
ncbi:MAG: OmpH family outer membrane protein [Saprospiraceae bacterium]|nr:OmpH family outer membrane protein [Pyrinomonadaceae bacterium]